MKLWIDVETTGRNAKKHDIIQLAAVKEIDNYKYRFNEFCCPINIKNVDPGAIKVHGISVKQMTEFQSSIQMLKKFCSFLGEHDVGYEIAGYNVGFDRSFLMALFNKLNFYQKYFHFFNTNIYDVYSRVRKKSRHFKARGLKNLKLETLARHYNIEIKAHDALSDIGATILIDQELDKLVEPEVNKFDPDHARMKEKYFDSGYIQFNAEGSIYIHERLRQDTEGFIFVLEELIEMAKEE